MLEYAFNPAGCRTLAIAPITEAHRQNVRDLNDRLRLDQIARWLDSRLVIHSSLLVSALRTLPAPQGELLLDPLRDGLWQRGPQVKGRTWSWTPLHALGGRPRPF